MGALSTLTQEVYNITNRPDLVNETETALKAALLKAHQSDFYPKDLFECAVQFNTVDYFQQFDVKSAIPLYRAFKYARYYDPVGGSAGRFFTFILPEKVVDEYKVERTDVVYTAGLNLNFKGSDQFQYILFGCYLNPDLTAGTSWMVDEHPYAIVFEAARVVFGIIGYQEQAAAYRDLVAEQFAEMKATQLLGQGY